MGCLYTAQETCHTCIIPLSAPWCHSLLGGCALHSIALAIKTVTSNSSCSSSSSKELVHQRNCLLSYTRLPLQDVSQGVLIMQVHKGISQHEVLHYCGQMKCLTCMRQGTHHVHLGVLGLRLNHILTCNDFLGLLSFPSKPLRAAATLAGLLSDWLKVQASALLFFPALSCTLDTPWTITMTSKPRQMWARQTGREVRTAHCYKRLLLTCS